LARPGQIFFNAGQDKQQVDNTAERGRHVDHPTIYRWVQRDAPPLEKRARAQWKPTNDSWRVDETSIKVRGAWMDLDRAVDSAGNTWDFMRSPHRPAGAAECFFRKARGQAHTVAPRVINGDKHPADPAAFAAGPKAGERAPRGALRPVKYLNNIVEQDHRWIQRRVRPG
jgi:transposase-like protein